jgi:glycerol-3-phosphate dehydrogenase
MSAEYDIVVVGGGITGAGIARDAALRGLHVALFDKADFGAGTSSKSSKLIHGGLRYLEQGELGLVFESVSERRVQSRVAPHLVRPLVFLLPIYAHDRVGVELMNLGLWVYDTLALFRAPALHKTYRGARALEIEPRLVPHGLRGAIEYTDCMTDDARLVLENVLDAARLGAACHSHAEVVALERARGKVRAVRVRDRLTGEERRVTASAVVVAGGPWTDQLARRLDLGFERPLLRPTKGVHLVFPRDNLPIERTVTMLSPVDGRVMFIIPWRERLVVGTTDTDFRGSPDDVHADQADADYLCRSVNILFPTARFHPEQAIASWAGLRPLIHEETGTASQVSREHELWAHDDGVFVIAGGKLTTYRLMAREAVDAALEWLRDREHDRFEGRALQRGDTKRRPLPGAEGLAAPTLAAVHAIGDRLVVEAGLEPRIARHLAETYGTRAPAVAARAAAEPALAETLQPDLPYLWAEIDFAVTDDRARTVDDVLSRRVPLALVGRDQGLDVVDRVTRRIGELCGWDAARREAEAAGYRASVAASRRFRRGSSH